MSVLSRNRRAPRLLAILPVALLAAHAAAQATEPELKARLLKQSFYLRGLWAQDNLKFDAAGAPRSKYDQIPFTLSGIDVGQVQLKKDKLVITGNRTGLEFAPRQKRVPLGDTMTIEIAGPLGTDFGPALDQILATDLSDLPPLPAYWRSYAQRNFMKRVPLPSQQSAASPPHIGEAPAGPANTPPKRIGGVVVAPIVVSMLDPVFTQAARRLKYSGKVFVRLRVLKDGSVSNVEIVTPIGLGLDEQAVAAAYHYRFKPAMEDGNPVIVELVVEVNFQIF
jgi:TonB family protein